MQQQYIIKAVLCLCLTFQIASSRPTEKSNVQEVGAPTRAHFLLDLLGTITNVQKTAQSATKTANEGVALAQQTAVDNTNTIVESGHKAIDADTQALNNALKSATDAGGQFANMATIVLFSFPKFLTDSAQNIVNNGS